MLCDFITRVSARFRLIATASAALCVGAATVLAPAASAHPQGGCRYAHSPVGAASRPQLQEAVVCLINQQRTHRHLPRLHENQRLNRSAQGWTDVMVRQDDFSHGADFSARISAVGFDWSMAGENIASGFMTPAAVVRGWMGSADHCRNILTPSFADVGTGVKARGLADNHRGGTWTQDFGLSMGAHAPSGNWGPADGCPY